MSKKQLKEKVIRTKGNKCALTKKTLPQNKSLFDTHRTIPKKDNGDYSLENTNVVLPVAHMKEHGAYRQRPEDTEVIKTLVDDISQLRKLKNKIANQLNAYDRRTDNANPITKQYLLDHLTPIKERLAIYEKILDKTILKMKKDPLVKCMLGVRGVGPGTIAHCLAYIDLEKARHASSLWAYTGLHVSCFDRYEKDEDGKYNPGNKTLRTALFNFCESQIKCKGPYSDVYYRTKERLAKSEKIVKSRNRKGNEIKVAWKDTMPSHRHSAGYRKMMKHFLADYWMVGRTLMGLPTSALYPEAILGGTHRTIMPEERGWVY